jgi:hypothetical protein
MYKLGHTVPIIGGLRYHDDEYCIHSPFRTSHVLRRSGTVGGVQDLRSSVYIEYRECAELDRLSIPLRPNILSFLYHKISFGIHTQCRPRDQRLNLRLFRRCHFLTLWVQKKATATTVHYSYRRRTGEHKNFPPDLGPTDWTQRTELKLAAAIIAVMSFRKVSMSLGRLYLLLVA